MSVIGLGICPGQLFFNCTSSSTSSSVPCLISYSNAKGYNDWRRSHGKFAIGFNTENETSTANRIPNLTNCGCLWSSRLVKHSRVVPSPLRVETITSSSSASEPVLISSSSVAGANKCSRLNHRCHSHTSKLATSCQKKNGTTSNRILCWGRTSMNIRPIWLGKYSVLVTRAERTINSSDSERDPDHLENEEGISPTLYRPFPFPDVKEIVRGLGPRTRTAYGLAFLTMLAVVAWIRNLGVVGLIDNTEPLFVEAARQMLVTGDYLTPQFNGQQQFDKPILIYWLMAISVKIFGTKVWAFRLPSCLCAMGLLMGLFLTVRHFGVHLSPDMETDADNLSIDLRDHFLPAIITAAAFALNLGVVALGSVALSDMLLTGTTGASLLSFFWAYSGRDHTPPKYSWGYPLSAVFVGLACLSNGPIGIMFPACVCTCFLLCTKELVKVFMEELPKVKGLLLLVLISLPWYGMMFSKHGSVLLSTLFGYHDIMLLGTDRETYDLAILALFYGIPSKDGGPPNKGLMRGVVYHRGQPWWFGLAVVLVIYFPWSLSLPSTIIEANPWRRRDSWMEYSRSKRLSLFGAIWFIVGFGLFSLSPSQHASHYLPIAPAVALLAASHLSLPPTWHSNGLATGLAPAFSYQLLAGLFWLLPNLMETFGSGNVAVIGSQLKSHNLHIFAFGVLAFAGTFATRTEEYAHAYSRVKAEPQSKKTLLPLWVLHVAAMVAFTCTFVNPCYKVVDGVRQSPVRQLAVKAAELQQPGETLIMVGENMPSVVFYSQLPTTFFETSVEAATSLKESLRKFSSALVISKEALEGSLQPVVLAQEQDFSLLRVVVPSSKTE